MISYQEALDLVLKNTDTLGTEEKSFTACIGQVTAEDIYSGYDLPMTDISGPDGYAVRADDIAGASPEKPVILKVIGTVRAGRLPTRPVEKDTAIRIMTGSSMPDGADCVVRFEDTDEPPAKNGPNINHPSRVKVYTSVKPGTNIRPAGTNTRKSSLVVPKATAIGPAQVSVLASIGKSTVKVVQRPVIAIIATGDEIISLKTPLSPGKAYNSNSVAMAALITHYGGIPKILGIARDNETSLLSKLEKGLTADAIITTGGVSMGDYDLVRLVMEKTGNLIFSRIKMGPGASFAFGTIEGKHKRPVPLFALSGPPAGCINNFETLVRPAMLKMMGYGPQEHPDVEAIAIDSIASGKDMAVLKWTKLEKVNGEYHVTLNSRTGILANMASSNSFTIIPEDAVIKKGDRLRVLPLDWRRS